MKDIADEDYEGVKDNLNKSQTSPDAFLEQEEISTKHKRRINEILDGEDE